MRFGPLAALTTAVALIPLAANAKPSWRTVYNANGVKVAVDSASIEKNADGSKTVWTVWDYKVPRILENKKSYTRLIEKAQLKCSPVVVKRVNTSLYDAYGKVVKAPEEIRESEVGSMSWDRPLKSSDGAKVWPAVCGFLAKKK